MDQHQQHPHHQKGQGLTVLVHVKGMITGILSCTLILVLAQLGAGAIACAIGGAIGVGGCNWGWSGAIGVGPS